MLQLPSSLPLAFRAWASPLAQAAEKGPKTLCVLLHGYGANKDDLIPLAPEFAPSLEQADGGRGGSLWLSPDAPQSLVFGGRQWFPLSSLSPQELDQGAASARAPLTGFLDAALQSQKLSWGDLVLVGFSQGCMMALEVGLRLPDAPKAIIGFSGRLAGDTRTAKEIQVKPPVLLVHGTADTVVPFASMGHSESLLKDLGVPVTSFACPGVGHGISPDGLSQARQFLQQQA